MKLIKLMVFVFVFAVSFPSFSNERTANSSSMVIPEPTAIDVMFYEVPVRVLSCAATIAGAGFFVGTLPISGLMTAFRPHKAFHKVLDYFVVSPFKYTFMRPVEKW